MTTYLLFTSQLDAEAYQAEANSFLGYPESIDDTSQVGVGVHAQPSLGLAQNYADLRIDHTGTRFALPVVSQIATPLTATEIDTLPADWAGTL